MDKKMVVYHGSSQIIEKPIFGYGNLKNDYGKAFYCTENIELAKEWACQEKLDGYANCYELNTNGLHILDLDAGEYHILNWLAILIQNRTFHVNSDIMIAGMEYMKENFLPEYGSFDVIIGYRADDSYFSFANAFLNNSISLERLEKVMFLGTLGEQIALKSERAFDNLKFIEAELAQRVEYYPKKMQRDMDARENYFSESRSFNGTFLIDIIRQKWRNDDERLQRIVLR